jgi:hypothetical protein
MWQKQVTKRPNFILLSQSFYLYVPKDEGLHEKLDTRTVHKRKMTLIQLVVSWERVPEKLQTFVKNSLIFICHGHFT